MELRFLEGNFEHGKFKLQYREGFEPDADFPEKGEWRDVPCVKATPDWCEHRRLGVDRDERDKILPYLRGGEAMKDMSEEKEYEKLAEMISDPIIHGDDVIGGFEIRTYHRALKVLKSLESRLKQVSEELEHSKKAHVAWADTATSQTEKIESLESRLKEAEQALTGRTVSCSACNDTAQRLSQAEAELEHGEKEFIAMTQDRDRLTLRLSHLMDVAIKIVEAEPELPGRMPDEMWALLKGNRDMTEKAQQQAVMLTKRNIIKTLKAEWDGIKSKERTK